MVGAAILAAGAGRRFGSGKQLATLAGRPLLEHAVETACSVAELERVVVVLGARAEEIERAVELGRAEAVVCDDWREGIAASLRCAVVELSACEAIVLLLGDQPGVTKAAVRAVLAAAEGADAARAVYGGAPGHPVVVRSSLFGRLRRLSGDEGARRLLDETGVIEVECSALATAHDVDTKADLERLRASP